jgi:hypothetical protein
LYALSEVAYAYGVPEGALGSILEDSTLNGTPIQKHSNLFLASEIRFSIRKKRWGSVQ